MSDLFQELKRRKVFKVGAAYAIVAWILMQVSGQVLPTFNAPEWVQQTLTFLFFLGFPITLVMAWAYEVTPEGVRADSGISVPQSANSNSDRKLIYVLLGLVSLIGGLQISDRLVFDQQVSPLVSANETAAATLTSELSWRTGISLGVSDPFAASGLNANIALSPDGRKLVYSVDGDVGDEPPRLYLREFDKLESQLLTTEFAIGPFFSHDSEWVGFQQNDELHKVSTRGGRSQQLTDSKAANTGAFWSAENWIYYISNYPEAELYRIAATGGVPELLEVSTRTINSLNTRPHLLPDGDSLLLSLRNFDTTGARDGQIDLLTLSTGDIRTVIQNGYNARYAPSGHIVFMRSASLWAVPFDLERLETTGSEVPVIQGVQTDGNRGGAVYTFSKGGLLAYLPGEDLTNSGEVKTLVWVDRDGNEETLSLERDFKVPVISPNGQRLAVVIEESGRDDIWIYDLVRNQLSVLTFAIEGDFAPLWTPDGERIVFASNREGGGLWSRTADGTGPAEQLLATPGALPYSFTPDGTQLVYQLNDDLFLLTLDSDSPPITLMQSEFIVARGVISPNGRWIAYQADYTGQSEIYVRPFPDVEAGGQWMISTEGGEWPKWNADGSELFYRTGSTGPNASVWSARVETESIFDYETPNRLVQGNYRGMGTRGAFDVSADGSQFMLIAGPQTTSESLEEANLVVVHNWFEELKRLAPPDSQ